METKGFFWGYDTLEEWTENARKKQDEKFNAEVKRNKEWFATEVAKNRASYEEASAGIDARWAIRQAQLKLRPEDILEKAKNFTKLAKEQMLRG